MNQDIRLLLTFDASSAQGYGHFNRCLTLARCFSDAGGKVSLVCNGYGLPDITLPERCDLHFVADQEQEQELSCISSLIAGTKAKLIVDHYRADPDYQRALKQLGIEWAQFDYKKAYPIEADWVININPEVSVRDYRHLVPESAELLLGSKFAVLRDEFSCAGFKVSSSISRVLMMLGAGDDKGQAEQLVSWIKTYDATVDITVVSTCLNPSLPRLQSLHDAGQIHLAIEPENISELMRQADLGICTAGTTSFEFAALGLPSICISIADNQVGLAETWHRLGVSLYLGQPADYCQEDFATVLVQIAAPEKREVMSLKARNLVDTEGALRIIRAMFI